MGASRYVRGLRERIGHDLLLLPSVAAFVFEHDRLLMVRHADGGLWAPPGGGVEADERPAGAAVREVGEETGIEVRVLQAIGTYGGPEFRVTYRNGDRCGYVIGAFLCERVGGHVRVDGAEIDDLDWVSPERIDLRPVVPWLAVVLPDALRARGLG